MNGTSGSASPYLRRMAALEKRSRRFLVLTRIMIVVSWLALVYIWILWFQAPSVTGLLIMGLGSALIGLNLILLRKMLDLEKWALYAFCLCSGVLIILQLIDFNWAGAGMGLCVIILYLRKDWALFRWDFSESEEEIPPDDGIDS